MVVFSCGSEGAEDTPKKLPPAETETPPDSYRSDPPDGFYDPNEIGACEFHHWLPGEETQYACADIGVDDCGGLAGNVVNSYFNRRTTCDDLGYEIPGDPEHSYFLAVTDGSMPSPHGQMYTDYQNRR